MIIINNYKKEKQQIRDDGVSPPPLSARSNYTHPS
jgi:hypothetical protein